eukprot:1013000-Prymnesium_polylepis.2
MLRETDGTWDNGHTHAWTQVRAALVNAWVQTACLLLLLLRLYPSAAVGVKQTGGGGVGEVWAGKLPLSRPAAFAAPGRVHPSSVPRDVLQPYLRIHPVWFRAS